MSSIAGYEMGDITERIKAKANDYDAGLSVGNLASELAVEKFCQIMFPCELSAAKVVAICEKNISTITMGAIEIQSKLGIEGQTSHIENSVSRVYSDDILAYKKLIPYVGVLK